MFIKTETARLRVALAIAALGIMSPTFAQTPDKPAPLHSGSAYTGIISVPGLELREDTERSQRDYECSLVSLKAFALLKAGKIDHAQQLFETLPRKSSEGVAGYIFAREGLGDIYALRGLWKKAAQEYEARFQFEPGYSAGTGTEMKTRAKLALALTHLGRLQEARQNYMLAWGLLQESMTNENTYTDLPLPNPSFLETGQMEPKVHLLLLGIYCRESQWDDARGEVDQLDKSGGEDPLNYLYRGIALRSWGSDEDKERAKGYLEKTLFLTENPQIKREARKHLDIALNMNALKARTGMQ